MYQSKANSIIARLEHRTGDAGYTVTLKRVIIHRIICVTHDLIAMHKALRVDVSLRLTCVGCVVVCTTYIIKARTGLKRAIYLTTYR